MDMRIDIEFDILRDWLNNKIITLDCLFSGLIFTIDRYNN